MIGLDSRFDDSNEVSEKVKEIAARSKAADKTALLKAALHLELLWLQYMMLQGKYMRETRRMVIECPVIIPQKQEAPNA